MNANMVNDKVVRLAARGDGVTQNNRFVARAVPGDEVAPDGRVIPGPGHVEPACRHYGSCGGCQLQHAADPVIAAFAADRILEPLRRVGLEPAQLMPPHMSPAGSRRRAAMRATRTRGEVRVGFNAEGQHSLVDIAECPVLHPALFALVAPLRRLLAPHLAERSAIGITLTLTDQGVDLLLANLQADTLPMIEGLTAFAETHRLARLSLEGPMGVETLVANADPSVRFGGVPVTLPPAAFLQATADGEAALVAAVSDIVGTVRTAADLFAGSGTFALPLSRAARVTAADAAGPAIRALESAARRAGRPVTALHRDLFRKPLTADELAPFDAVVIDPPRAGAEAQMAELARSRVPVIAAVSCNPSTFARDAALLAAGGYQFGRLWPVAQFRWSTHIELVAEFRR
jgi:23S rRNA (uracil1939-C5)-methyltransferase